MLPDEENFISYAWKRANADTTETLQSFRGYFTNSNDNTKKQKLLIKQTNKNKIEKNTEMHLTTLLIFCFFCSFFCSFSSSSFKNSPYFFNAGLFNSGQLLMETGEAYASALLERPDVEYDVLFGPAYKGITLVSGLSIALARRGVNKDFAYNRKEKKDHGEGGVLVGASVEGKRVLIVDDVITAGTAIREAITLLKAAGAIIAGVVIGKNKMKKQKHLFYFSLFFFSSSSSSPSIH